MKLYERKEFGVKLMLGTNFFVKTGIATVRTKEFTVKM